jgi:hypothetical protein
MLRGWALHLEAGGAGFDSWDAWGLDRETGLRFVHWARAMAAGVEQQPGFDRSGYYASATTGFGVRATKGDREPR